MIDNFVLYSKHWYKRSNNIWADIKKCLEADEYLPDDKADMLSIIINHFAPLLQHNGSEYYTRELIFGVTPEQCWKYGYYTKEAKWIKGGKEYDELPDYDYMTAVLYYFMSNVSSMEISKIGKLKKPLNTVLEFSSIDTKNRIKETWGE